LIENKIDQAYKNENKKDDLDFNEKLNDELVADLSDTEEEDGGDDQISKSKSKFSKITTKEGFDDNNNEGKTYGLNKDDYKIDNVIKKKV